MTRFKDLAVGARFVFADELKPLHRYYGLARGPWVKLSARIYKHETDTAYARVHVGSINARVAYASPREEVTP
jgi:hypothetical protein